MHFIISQKLTLRNPYAEDAPYRVWAVSSTLGKC